MLLSGIFFNANGDFRFTLFALLGLGIGSWLAARQGEKRSAALKAINGEKGGDAGELCVCCGTPVSPNDDEVVELVMTGGNAAIDGMDIAKVQIPCCADCRAKMSRDERRAITMRILFTLVGGLVAGVFAFLKHSSATGRNAMPAYAMVLIVLALTLMVGAFSLVMFKPAYLGRMRAYHKVKLLRKAGFRIKKVCRMTRPADAREILEKLKSGRLSAAEAERELLRGSGK